jgi:hypothetical protein
MLSKSASVRDSGGGRSTRPSTFLSQGSRVIERAAAQLAGSFDLDVVVNAIAAFAGPDLSAIQEKPAKAQKRAADVFASLYLPQLPTRHQVVRRALAMFAEAPSMDVIVTRAPMP